MSSGLYNLSLEDLPETLPIFTFSGALLLPRGRLPLNIYEPRYLNLTEDALGNRRMIGMVQPAQQESDPVSDDAEIFPVGCVGRIVSFAEIEDGRFLITLEGISRFRIAQELESVRGYRRVTAHYKGFSDDLVESAGTITDRPRLLQAVNALFELRDIDAEWSDIENAPDEILITSLAMICPFEAREKQALLECSGLTERGELLTALLEIAVLDANGAPDLNFN